MTLCVIWSEDSTAALQLQSFPFDPRPRSFRLVSPYASGFPAGFSIFLPVCITENGAVDSQQYIVPGAVLIFHKNALKETKGWGWMWYFH